MGAQDGAASPAEAALQVTIGEAIAANVGHHPGIIAEAVVARLLEAYELTPREAWHRERRRNHEERIRRFSHEVYRLLEDPAGGEPVEEIAARVTRAFLVAPRAPASPWPTGGRP